MHVVGVLTGRRAATAVAAPAGARQPDLAIPDDVQDAEPVGVENEEGGQTVPVRSGLAVRVAAEPAGLDREVARASLRVLTPVVVAAPARVVVAEAGLEGLVAGERQGQRVLYRLKRDTLLNALAELASAVDGPLRREPPREAL